MMIKWMQASVVGQYDSNVSGARSGRDKCKDGVVITGVTERERNGSETAA